MGIRKSNITDMTEGSPIKHILLFTLPLLCGNLFQQFYNMVDSIVVGRFVGKQALAAVGACGSMAFLFFSVSNGLGVGIGVLIAQYFGAKQERMVRKTIINSYYVLMSITVIISSIGFLVSPSFLRFLHTPEEILADSTIYMQVTCLGIIGTAFYNGLASMLRALGDSKTPLYFLMVASVLNVCLDLTFVVGMGLGVFGVAIATAISQIISALLCFAYAYKTNEYFKTKGESIKPDWNIIKKTYRLGLPLGAQGMLIAISCIALQKVVNSFGADVVATFTILNRVEQIVQQPFNSLGAAITTFTGQNLGAGKIDRIKKGFWQAVLVVAAFSVALLPVTYLCGKNIIEIFVTDPAIIQMGATALRIDSPFYFTLGMIYAPRALLNGCGDSSFAMINGITEVLCRIIFSNAFLLLGLFGGWCIYIANALTWSVTAVVCMFRYFQGKWKLVKV